MCPEGNEGALCYVKMHTQRGQTQELLSRVWYRVGKFIQTTQASECACIPRHRWEFRSTEYVCPRDKSPHSKLCIPFSGRWKVKNKLCIQQSLLSGSTATFIKSSSIHSWLHTTGRTLKSEGFNWQCVSVAVWLNKRWERPQLSIIVWRSRVFSNLMWQETSPTSMSPYSRSH